MSFGVVYFDDVPLVILDSLDAMYVNAQQCGNTELMKILEHRAEAHDGGPCHCKDRQ
jgi:hypothetical protein